MYYQKTDIKQTNKPLLLANEQTNKLTIDTNNKQTYNKYNCSIEKQLHQQANDTRVKTKKKQTNK